MKKRLERLGGCLRKLCPCIIMQENVFVSISLACHIVRAVLTQTNAVTIAFGGKKKGINLCCDGEVRGAQPQQSAQIFAADL